MGIDWRSRFQCGRSNSMYGEGSLVFRLTLYLFRWQLVSTRLFQAVMLLS